MHYVILRDDDTNALTPPECLEQLYRPFLDKDLPVNLAVIPDVRTDARRSDGQIEGFLPMKRDDVPGALPIGANRELVTYLQANQGFHIAQHGCHHDCREFERGDRRDVRCRLHLGINLLMNAGFARPTTFVAPHDALSRTSLEEVARQFRVLSAGWFELRRIPVAWWPKYLVKRLLKRPHWQMAQTILLSHPGCLLWKAHARQSTLREVIDTIENQKLTVLVTHWWEFFQAGRPDAAFIHLLHECAEYLASQADVQVISFDDLAQKGLALRST